MSVASRRTRKRFLLAFLRGLRVVWPILSTLLVTMAGLGALIGFLQGWGVLQGIYFAFVTGLTIGYGDLAPTRVDTRLLSIGIGACGILLTGLVAAVGVQALQAATPLHATVPRYTPRDERTTEKKEEQHDGPARP